jgi:UDP-N-acetylglucosamine 2-epimerase
MEAMRQASAPSFRKPLQGLANPYGDGHAAERIVAGLIEAPSREQLLHKRALQLAPNHDAFKQQTHTAGED